jgi:hypothetical protein
MATSRPDPNLVRRAPEARGSERRPTPAPIRRSGHSPNSGCIPILERRPKALGSTRLARSNRDSWISPFDGLKPSTSRAVERHGTQNKKADVAAHRGVWPRRLTLERAPRPSRVALYLVIRQLQFMFFIGADCETMGPLTTFIVPRKNGKASELFCDFLRYGSVTSSFPRSSSLSRWRRCQAL